MVEANNQCNQIIMDHLKNPRNKGEMEDPDGVGEAQNPVCGDTMRIFIKVESERIIDVTFLAFGCSAAIASSSLTTEILKGKTINEALSISNEYISEAMGRLPPSKIHCSILAEKAIKEAIKDYWRKKEEKGK